MEIGSAQSRDYDTFEGTAWHICNNYIFIDMTEYLLDTTEEKDYSVLHFRRGHSPLSRKTWQQECGELVILDPQSGSR